MKAEFVEWKDIKQDMKLPEDDNNDGYVYGIHYLDDEGVDVIEAEWFKTNEERYAEVEKEKLDVINYIG